MSKITTKDLIKEVATDLGTTQVNAKEIFDTVIGTIVRVVTEQQVGVPLGALGNLKVDVKAERTYAGIQGEDKNVAPTPTTVPAHYAAKVAISKTVKDALKAATLAE